MNVSDLNPYSALIKVGLSAAALIGVYFLYEHQLSVHYQEGYDDARKICDSDLAKLKANKDTAVASVQTTAAVAGVKASDAVHTQETTVASQPVKIKYVAIQCPVPSVSSTASSPSVVVPQFTDAFISDLNNLITSANQALQTKETK